jgi:hypothetical protein
MIDIAIAIILDNPKLVADIPATIPKGTTPSALGKYPLLP